MTELGSKYRKEYDILLNLEERLDLFNQRVSGIRFWELIRTTVFNLAVGGWELKPSTQSTSKLERYKFYLHSIINLNRNPFFPTRPEILFLTDAIRYLREDGKWWDIFTDILIQKSGISYVMLEHYNELMHLKPAITKHLRYSDFLDVLARIKTLIRPSNISLTKRERGFLHALRKEIQVKLGLDLDIEGLVVRILKGRKTYLPIYIWLLRFLRPKIVIVVCSYGKEVFIEACKTVGIPVAELQHGIIDRNHPGYSLPGPNRVKATFPDYLLVFGEYWKKNTEYPIELEKIEVIGYPYSEEQRQKYSEMDRKNQIIFLSQPYAGEKLSKMALHLSEADEIDCRVVYRPHPSEIDSWRERYPWLINSRVVIADMKTAVLYRLLAESSYQIGVSSTSIFEGLSLGLRTFILDIPGSEVFNDLIERGIAKKVTSAKELIAFMKDRNDLAPVDVEQLFLSNSIENFKAFLKDKIH
ncbi:MAG: hypothetical protein ACW987_01730 [Candidatus Thorarchaeota archaeon]|jgi:hypothetical protein